MTVTTSGPFPIRMDLPGDSDPRWKDKKRTQRRVRRPSKKSPKR